ncbi:CBS domain-containing protein [Streptomyces sp. NPDC059165]|uniref:CBS domain-containing protein n=1 Tax=Streptomyces sp. NPDC059165 TaxID=3346751 RepID=UPI00369D077B
MKHSEVGNLMSGDVVSVVPATPFKDVAKQLAEHDISGVPVVDEEDRVVGVISETDLLVHQVSAGGSGRTGARPDRRVLPVGGSGDAPTAQQLMSVPAVTVHADDTVAEAARTMLRQGVERLPVVDEEGRLVGIVTRRDLLTVFLRPDREIRRRVIEEVLVDTLGLAPDAVDVHVLDGAVTLTGVLQEQKEILVLRRLVEQMDGVVSVTDRLTARTADAPITASGPASQDLPAK